MTAERKIIADIASRSRAGDHLTQLQRMLFSGLQHVYLLVEGNLNGVQKQLALGYARPCASALLSESVRAYVPVPAIHQGPCAYAGSIARAGLSRPFTTVLT